MFCFPVFSKQRDSYLLSAGQQFVPSRKLIIHNIFLFQLNFQTKTAFLLVLPQGANRLKLK